jgi:hypothetical protein
MVRNVAFILCKLEAVKEFVQRKDTSIKISTSQGQASEPTGFSYDHKNKSGILSVAKAAVTWWKPS